MTGRLCEPGCPTPDAPHVEAEVDWIGDAPIAHGESERPVPGSAGPASWGTPDAYCLCGHPNYLTCPYWPSDGVAGLTLAAPDDH